MAKRPCTTQVDQPGKFLFTFTSNGSTLYRLKIGSKTGITNSLFNSNHHLFLYKQKSTLINDHASATQDRTKYDHDIKLHTDGLIKTIIKNSRELYSNLRDDFRANWGFNTVLIIIVFSYIGVFIGRFKLEYDKTKLEYEKGRLRAVFFHLGEEEQMNEKAKLEHEKAKREEKQMELDHVYKMMELSLRENFDPQRIKQILSNEQTPSSSK
ncbi:unnamed protein product [Rotaria magnacalcarata]|uniref:Transmembrane protein n=2 Tax=Rotaria magnacalcarata TaxID=392030 RepID=A0A8S3AT32_9BILA|nr:unnamed protein product [Rotaria magnacalcarata]